MTVTAPVAVPGVDLTEAGARALLADIRTAISAAQDLLRLAWRQRIWIALGHASWDDFVTAELGDLRLKLPVDERRAEVGAWRAEGASVRAIASALGVCTGTVAADLADALDEKNSRSDESAVVISLDGRRRAATATAKRKSTTRPVSLRVLDTLAAAGADGLTFSEASRKLRTRDGTTTSALHRLELQGHVYRDGQREGRSVYRLAIYWQ